MDEMTRFSLEPQPQLGERVYRVLMESIVSQILESGQHLVIEDLAVKMGTSGTPIREALSRLQQEGLVSKIPYQGWKVRQFTVDEITELYQVRAALEGLAVRICCEQHSEKTLQQLMELQAQGIQAMSEVNLEEYRRYNDELHDIILQATGNGTLQDMMNTLKNRIRLFSETTIRFPGRPQRALGEHAELIECIRVGDGVRGVALMEQHISSALQDLVAREGGHGK